MAARIFRAVALAGAIAIVVAGCAGFHQAGGITTKADKAADEYWVRAETVQERQARAWSAAAVLSQVVREKVMREPEKAAQAAGSLEAMGAVLKSGLEKNWPAFSLYRIRVSMYRAVFSGLRGRAGDYVGLTFSPFSVLDEVEGLFDAGALVYMREDVICHFGALPDAGGKLKSRCEMDGALKRDMTHEKLVGIYKSRFEDNLSFVKSTLRE